MEELGLQKVRAEVCLANLRACLWVRGCACTGDVCPAARAVSLGLK